MTLSFLANVYLATVDVIILCLVEGNLSVFLNYIKFTLQLNNSKSCSQ